MQHASPEVRSALTPLERLQTGSLCLLLAVLPLAHARAAQSIMIACSLLLFLPAFCRPQTHFSDSLPGVLWWVLAMWPGVALLSALWSADPGRSLLGAIQSAVAPTGIFLAALAAGRNPRMLRRVLVGGSAGIALLCLTTIGGLLKGGIPLVSQGANAVLASDLIARWYPGPGLASTFALIGLPLSWWIWRERLLPWGGALVLAALLIGLLSFNRMYWLGLVVLIVIWMVSYRSGRYAPTKGRSGLLLICLCALVTLALLSTTVVRQSGSLSGQSIVQASHALAKDPRWSIWSQWLDSGMQRPLLGTGYGKEVARQVHADHFAPITAEMMDQAGKSHPHNLLLSLWIQTGLPGLLAFLCLMASLASLAAAHARRDTPARHAALALGMTIAMLFFKNLTDDFYDIALPAMFWAYAGLMAGAMRGKTPT
ncbi:MAG: hypothetical protein CGU28_04565 [Candidatus Dactylopiibacterium carminicum]|nr:MAG: hypothetical protein CGU28_04565 [Candidatus Dactylopiibacterium carminicum]